MTQKIALVSGVTGQDGSYLSDLLLSKGYIVHGIMRRTSFPNTSRIEHLVSDERLKDRFFLHYADLADANSLRSLIDQEQPDEVYNLAAQSHVRISFDQPEYTIDVTGTGVLRFMEAIRTASKYRSKEIRFYQAGSSEMFGSAKPRQHEGTRFEPRSPYACAKVYAHYQVINYRESYGLFACNGILFNHESPRRGENFVTRKITRAATRIKLGLQNELHLGNLDARRDWGYAADYVEAMWLMLQQEAPNDYVVATGTSISIRDFLDAAFEYLDLDWKKYVVIDPKFYRPAEVDHLEGDSTRARKQLGWEPKTDIKALVRMMVDSDMQSARRAKQGIDEL